MCLREAAAVVSQLLEHLVLPFRDVLDGAVSGLEELCVYAPLHESSVAAVLALLLLLLVVVVVVVVLLLLLLLVVVLVAAERVVPLVAGTVLLMVEVVVVVSPNINMAEIMDGACAIY